MFDRAHPEKREYLIEAFARDRGWVRQAKEFYGCRCLFEGCENTFKKPNGNLYIEIHHMIPLCVAPIRLVPNLMGGTGTSRLSAPITTKWLTSRTNRHEIGYLNT
jgi:hypothetical protein